jgi:hypothetical protein
LGTKGADPGAELLGLAERWLAQGRSVHLIGRDDPAFSAALERLRARFRLDRTLRATTP